MEDIYYYVYDFFADVRDAIADVADKFIAFATGVVDHVLCRVGWWVLDAIVHRFCAYCQSPNCQIYSADEACAYRPRWTHAADKIGLWLVGTNK